MQVAAGGSKSEEASAVAMLEHALVLSPGLHASFDNMMQIGDVHRGLGNSTRARLFYLLAVSLNPRISTVFVYAGLTYEQQVRAAGLTAGHELGRKTLTRLRDASC